MSTSAPEMKSMLSVSTRREVSHVGVTASLGWLSQGFRDFRNAPGLSLIYGFLFAGLCAGVYLLVSSVPWYSVGYLTGLVVVRPFLAAGIYVASRDM